MKKKKRKKPGPKVAHESERAKRRNISMNDRDYNIASTLADSLGLSLSEFIRKLVFSFERGINLEK